MSEEKYRPSLSEQYAVGRYQPVAEEIARLTAERDEARDKVCELSEALKANTVTYANEFQTAEIVKLKRELFSALIDGTVARKERDEARSERDKYEELLKSTQQHLMDRNNELLEARQELANVKLDKAAQDRTVQVQRPTGRIEALEARVAKLERIGAAR